MRGAEQKNVILAVLAAGLSAVAEALGGWDGALQLLVGLMAADYVTGVLVAAVWRKSRKTAGGALDSRAGFEGLLRKGAVLALVWIGALLDRTVGTGYARTAMCLFFAGNEGLSLVENLGLMGAPIPRFLRTALEALRDRGDEGGGE